MALVLNLEKLDATKKKLALCLEKAGIVTPPPVELAFVLDVSGSYTAMHTPQQNKPSVTELLLERITPWGMVFDPDKKLDVVTFSNGKDNCTHVGSMTADNYTTFVENNVVDCKGWNGGTDYAYAIEKCLELFGYIESEKPVRKGFFASLFSSGKDDAATGNTVKRKSLVLFNTDGENTDKRETERVLAESEARGDQVYFMFLGVNRDVRKFAFLQQMAEKFSNVAFHHIADYEAFVKLSDEDLNSILLTDEFMKWVAK